jgi:glycosyltransferase involved in cell wall biosynthesis
MFREASIFALPSYGEGVPVSLIEAMSYGLPSVVTNVGGIPETVKEGVEALIISPGDISALSAALVRLLKAPDLRIRLGQAARLRSQKCYSSQAFFMALRELYTSLNCLPQLS